MAVNVVQPDDLGPEFVVGPGFDPTHIRIDAAAINDIVAFIQANETTTSLAYNGTTGNLTYTDEDGVVTTLNVGVENFLSAASYDAPTNVLTLTLANGMTFPIDLTDLVDPVSVAASITGGASPLFNLDVNGSVQSLPLEDVQDAFGNHLFYAFQ